MLTRQLGRLLAAALLLTLNAVQAEAQARWVTDKKASLAWWQMNPHLNHLWATTCPEEPSWRPGEGRSAGWSISQVFQPPKHGYAATSDTTIIPLYPRRKVRSVCTEAVSGEITVADTVAWKGVKGRVTVRVDALVGGEERRDLYARRAILESNQFPEVAYQIDSLVGVSRKGDTLLGTTVGVFSLHGVSQPVNAAVKFWHEAGGVRVMGKFHINAEDLVPVYGLSKFALGLGVGARVWVHLWQGVDLLLMPGSSSGN